MATQVMLGRSPELGHVDKRLGRGVTGHNPSVDGAAAFTANGAGTTTTIVGANAAPGTNDANVVRRGEKFKVFTGAGVLKEETVVRVTGVAVAASTTVTFTPALAANTASGDELRPVGGETMEDMESIDRRLTAIDGTLYSANNLLKYTLNDKIFALRNRQDSGGL